MNRSGGDSVSIGITYDLHIPPVPVKPYGFCGSQASCLGKGVGSERWMYIASVALRPLPPRKDVLNQCLEFGMDANPKRQFTSFLGGRYRKGRHGVCLCVCLLVYDIWAALSYSCGCKATLKLNLHPQKSYILVYYHIRERSEGWGIQSSGAVWNLRWPSWAPRP